jgi:hypothetical protein
MQLGSLLGGCASGPRPSVAGAGPSGPHFAPRARRVLVFQSEGVSHIDLFDDKPTCTRTPARSCRRRGTQRVTGMTSAPATSRSCRRCCPANAPAKAACGSAT